MNFHQPTFGPIDRPMGIDLRVDGRAVSVFGRRALPAGVIVT